jgi:hypothetical protein
MIMAALIKVTVTATYRGKSYTGEAEVEVERLDQKYMIAHMDLIRDLPAGRQGDCVPLRDRDFDAGTLAWTPEGWCYEPPEFSYDEQHLLRRLANDACRYRDCRGATLDHLRAKGLATWNPTTDLPTADHCWVSLTKAGFAVADWLTGRR